MTCTACSVLTIGIVHGHEKIPAGGQFRVLVGGQIEVLTLGSSCRGSGWALRGDGGGANQSPHRAGDTIEEREGTDGRYFRLS